MTKQKLKYKQKNVSFEMDEERKSCKISTETDATILCWELNSIHASVYGWSSLPFSDLCLDG